MPYNRAKYPNNANVCPFHARTNFSKNYSGKNEGNNRSTINNNRVKEDSDNKPRESAAEYRARIDNQKLNAAGPATRSAFDAKKFVNANQKAAKGNALLSNLLSKDKSNKFAARKNMIGTSANRMSGLANKSSSSGGSGTNSSNVSKAQKSNMNFKPEPRTNPVPSVKSRNANLSDQKKAPIMFANTNTTATNIYDTVSKNPAITNPNFNKENNAFNRSNLKAAADQKSRINEMKNDMLAGLGISSAPEPRNSANNNNRTTNKNIPIVAFPVHDPNDPVGSRKRQREWEEKYGHILDPSGAKRARMQKNNSINNMNNKNIGNVKCNQQIDEVDFGGAKRSDRENEKVRKDAMALRMFGGNAAAEIKKIDLKKIEEKQSAHATQAQWDRWEREEARREELEGKDDEAANRVEVKEMLIGCFYCVSCKDHFQSLERKVHCETTSGHTVLWKKDVKKWRIECGNCKFSTFMLNQAWPKGGCRRCRSDVWKRVSFYTQEKVGFEKDKFCARGTDHQRWLDSEQGAADDKGVDEKDYSGMTGFASMG